MATLQEKTKLTLWVNPASVDYGKQWAKDNKRSLSSLVEDFLDQLRVKLNRKKKLSPRLARMSGILKGKSVGKEDYYAYLEKKYLRE